MRIYKKRPQQRINHPVLGPRNRTRNSWNSAKHRCINPNNPAYKNYGGRGIKMCPEWLSSFDQFISDMGLRPEGHEIERIDNDGPYCKANCRWATRKEQSRNRRSVKWVSHEGVSLTLSEYAEKIGVNYSSLYAKHIRRGKPLDMAVNECMQKAVA